MEYVLRFDSNIRALWNETVTAFLGYLKSKSYRLVTSETVRKEINGQIPFAVNRVVDKVRPRRSGQIRGMMLTKNKVRFQKFLSHVDVKSIPVDTHPVARFYNDLLKNVETKAKLVKISQLKGRKRLLPEDSDIVILSEAISLKSEDTTVFFISKDEDFCQFVQEIETRFGLVVLPVQNLLSFKDVLDDKA
jgi:hypothetical protein